jgi:uncharacterized protein YecT (DUF1311 family)
MDDLWVQVDDNEPVRQGDIVRQLPPDGSGQPTWSFVLTADCDIAQGKACGQFSVLRILGASDFLELRWAPDQLTRLTSKQAKVCAERLSSLFAKLDAGLDTLTPESLCTWLKTEDVETVLSAASSPSQGHDAKLEKTLRALRNALGAEGAASNLERLQRAWTFLGRDASAQQAAIRESFEGEKGFADFFFLPELPTTETYGFAVMLREISAIQDADVFVSEPDARINDRPDGYHRIGRLNDRVRFAITQRLAFLFSRIGLSSAFEDSCRFAAQLVVEAVPEAFGEPVS